MQAMYKIIRGKDFIKARPNGISDLEQSKQVLLELAMIAGLSPKQEILLDIRETDAGLTHEGVYELIKELEKTGIFSITRSPFFPEMMSSTAVPVFLRYVQILKGFRWRPLSILKKLSTGLAVSAA